VRHYYNIDERGQKVGSFVYQWRDNLVNLLGGNLALGGLFEIAG